MVISILKIIISIRSFLSYFIVTFSGIITAKKFKEDAHKRGFWLEFSEVQQNGKNYALHANVDIVDGNPVSVKVKNSTNHNLTKVERMV